METVDMIMNRVWNKFYWNINPEGRIINILKIWWLKQHLIRFQWLHYQNFFDEWKKHIARIIFSILKKLLFHSKKKKLQADTSRSSLLNIQNA